MSQHPKKFVFAKKNINISGSIPIEKDDVGIVESESKEGVSIFFIRTWQKVTLDKNDSQIFDVKKNWRRFLQENF